MVALIVFYGILWEASGNDIIAIKFHMSLNTITWFNRIMVFVGPVIAFAIARRWCISLQRADQDRLLHGYESGVLMRSPEGAYAEKHLPIPVSEAYTLTARDREEITPMPSEADLNGVANREAVLMRLQAKAQQAWYGKNIQKPTREELAEAQLHAEHELAAHDSHGHQKLPADGYLGTYELDGHPADGHQNDGHYTAVEDDELRK